MCDVDEMFDYLRKNIELAQRDFHGANPDGFDYFLASASLNISKIRSMYGRKPCEPAESSKES
jgi:hypothetical protein